METSFHQDHHTQTPTRRPAYTYRPKNEIGIEIERQTETDRRTDREVDRAATGPGLRIALRCIKFQISCCLWCRLMGICRRLAQFLNALRTGKHLNH